MRAFAFGVFFVLVCAFVFYLHYTADAGFELGFKNTLYIYLCIYIYMHTPTYLPTYLHTYVHSYIRVHMHTYVHAQKYFALILMVSSFALRVE